MARLAGDTEVKKGLPWAIDEKTRLGSTSLRARPRDTSTHHHRLLCFCFLPRVEKQRTFSPLSCPEKNRVLLVAFL